MAITGGMAAALRRDAANLSKILAGARVIIDFAGNRTARVPFYWKDGRRYSDLSSFPGWNYSGSAASGGIRYARNRSGLLVPFADNIPRITDKGFLNEEQRTNLQHYSQGIGSTGWSANGSASSIQNSAAAPDGSITASQITTGAAGAGYFSSAVSVVSGNTYTSSGFIKRLSGSSQASLIVAGQGAFGGTGGDRSVTIDTSTGAFISKSAAVSSYTIVPYTDSYWRVSGTFTATATSGSAIAFYTLSGSAVFLAWGAQIEIASSPGSYIPTPTNAPVTRNADNAFITNLSNILVPPFTMVPWADVDAADGVNRNMAAASDGAASNVLRIQRTSANTMRLRPIAGGTAQNPVDFTSITGAGMWKAAARLRSGAVAMAFNGSLSSTSITTTPSGMDRIVLGKAEGASVDYLNDYIQGIDIYGELPDGYLQGQTL